MNVNDSLFETPTRNATSRFKSRGNGVSSFVLPGNTKSPSQRLKDLFFATYTGGGADSQSSQKTTRSRDSILTSASLQTPTKTPGTNQGSSLVNSDDLMDLDSPVAQRTRPYRETEESHISEEDLKGPAVPLAISTSGRFYSEHMRRCELRIELMGLSTMGHNPRGVYVMPSLGSINKWHGVMFIKRGYWNNAVVRFCIDIPREYPSAHPVITLMTRVSHPLVRLEDGRFALEQQFPQWAPYSDYIYHALHYLKNAFKNRVLKQLQPRDCYNISAYMKFKNDLPQFREHARIDSLQSRHPNALYGSQPPDCPIVFTQLSEDQFESTMQQIKSFVAVANPPVAA